MLTTLTITLPLPPRCLSPNARPHWRTKAKATKAYRREAALVTIVTIVAGGFDKKWPAATAQATFYFAQNRRRDRDNLLASMKAAFDGIADAGLVVNDAAITHLPVVIAVDKSNPRVEVTLQQQEAGR